MTIQFTNPEAGHLSSTMLDGISSEHDIHGNTGFMPNYLGIMAIGDIQTNPRVYREAGLLRAQVYIDEKHFLGEDARRPDGTEEDEDDARSVHLAVTNRQDESSASSVIGVSRLIRKFSEDEPLPSERLFDIPSAPINSIEVSRFIAKHPNKQTQHLASLALMRAATFEGIAEAAPYVYAVVEEGLFRRFQMIGLPFTALTDLSWLPEYSSKNRAIRVDPRRVIPALKKKDLTRPESQAVAPFFEKAKATHGLGSFGEEF
jgi:N-acyl-L-homoserine lactone synthetase